MEKRCLRALPKSKRGWARGAEVSVMQVWRKVELLRVRRESPNPGTSLASPWSRVHGQLNKDLENMDLKGYQID